MKKARAAPRRRCALALPGVERDVVVIVAGRDKRGAAGALLQREAQNPAVEAERPVEVGDIQMHVPEVRRRRFPRQARPW